MKPQEPEPLRIRQIRIDGLFGLYNHCINLNLKERVTILHGPNGVGKTITLKMVEALSNMFVQPVFDNSIFFQVPFDLFIVEFIDNSSIEFSLSDENNQVYLELTSNDGRSFKDALRNLKGTILSNIENRDSSHGTRLIQNKLNTHFISVDRLTASASEEDRPKGLINSAQRAPSTIASYSRDLSNQIESTLASYAKESQILDQSFPLRLFSVSPNPLENTELKHRMEELERHRSELQRLGLLDGDTTQQFDPAKLDELISQESKVMALYVKDTEQKLSLLTNLAHRIKLLLDNINSKFKNKRLRIDRDKGFLVTNDAGQDLDLDSLSSGEQHEIVLLYDLLFRIKPNTLVLIDEPELSLHVAWQKRFLPDLLRIAEVAQIDVLMATHSPYIVEEYTDLMVALETGTRNA